MLNLFAKTYELTNGNCYVDGVLQSSTSVCTQALHRFLGIGLAIFIPLILISIAFFVFWIIMLVHAANHADIPSRGMWLAILLVSFFVGLTWLAALIYYFAVKRPYSKHGATPTAQPVSPPATAAPIAPASADISTPAPLPEAQTTQPPAEPAQPSPSPAEAPAPPPQDTPTPPAPLV